MSDQNLDYATIRHNVAKSLEHQRWMYRIVFFGMHMLFFVVTMLAVWGTVANDAQLFAVLFNPESEAALIVILPTIMWAAVFLFHIASLFFESRAGEKTLRERLLMSEIRKDMLRKGYEDEESLEKPKRRARVLDDGELMPVDEDERIEQNEYNHQSRRR